MSLESMVQYFKMRDLTGSEIEKTIGRPPILYSDLKKYKSLKQLLQGFGYAIILLQTSSKTTGHFIAITQNNNTGKYRFSDSYGMDPTTILSYLPYDKNLPQYIVDLFRGVDSEHNTIDYQSKNNGVSTCGRWATLFCKFRDLSLPQFHAIFKTNKSAYLQQSDNDACLLTLMMLDDITSYLSTITGSSRLP